NTGETTMAIKDTDTPQTNKSTVSESIEGTNEKGTEFVTRPYYGPAPQRKKSMISPFGVIFIAVVAMVALVSYGIGATMVSNPSNTSTSASSSSGADSTSMSNTSDTNNAPTGVPNATQEYGGQLAKSSVDPDGAKHFTFTAQQVMWEPVKG